ncbi:MAG: DUF1587 domain-containing protein, partial [Blastocatellia bacterium]
MRKKRLQQALAFCALVIAVFYLGWPARARQTGTAGHAAQQALINEYCVSCHNQKSKTADIVLEGLDFSNVGARLDVWEKVLRKVRTHQMPPAKAPQPDAHETAAFVGWLETALDKNALRNPNPGRPAVHRLNRAEYSNAIRDLLAVDVKPGQWLPVDDSGYGF